MVRQYGVFLCVILGIDQADLVQEGALALVQAFNRYDDSKGSTFRTFCSHRVRGAILDYLRDQRLVSRSFEYARRRAQDVDERYMRDFSRHPTTLEYCAELGYTEAQWQVMRLGINALLPMCNFENPIENEETGRHVTVGDIMLIDPNTVETLVERMETITEVRDALAKLPAAQEAALRGKYFDHSLAKETAAMLGVKPDRITRLNRQGLAALRESLAHLRTGEAPIVEDEPKKRTKTKRRALPAESEGLGDSSSASPGC
jgi:RNA polymerase sigma factor for flagellar operon FliA